MAGYHQHNVIIFDWTLDSREPPNQSAALPQAIMNFNAIDQKRKYRSAVALANNLLYTSITFDCTLASHKPPNHSVPFTSSHH